MEKWTVDDLEFAKVDKGWDYAVFSFGNIVNCRVLKSPDGEQYCISVTYPVSFLEKTRVSKEEVNGILLDMQENYSAPVVDRYVFELEFGRVTKRLQQVGDRPLHMIEFNATRGDTRSLMLCHLMPEEGDDNPMRYIGIEVTDDVRVKYEALGSIKPCYLEAKVLYEVQLSPRYPIIAWETERIEEIKERIGRGLKRNRN